MGSSKKSDGPDLTQGISLSTLADGGMLVGRVGDDEVLLARSGSDVFAVGAHCTHYHGPLADGLIVGDTVRCPWHHACFSLRTGSARARAGARSDRLLEGRARRRSHRRAREDRRPRAPKVARRCAFVGRDCRRRRRGSGGRRDAAARRLRRADHDDQRRRPRHRSIGPTSRRTIWPARRRRTGFRCGRRSFTPSSGSSCCSSHASPAIDSGAKTGHARSGRRASRSARC